MELVLLRDERISLFNHSTFQHYVFILSTRFVRFSGNSLSHKTWSHFLFALHCEADLLMLGLWWTCLRYDSSFLMLETNEPILKLMVITFCRKRPSSVIGFLAIWAHKHAGKHMFSVNNCSYSFRIQKQLLRIHESVSINFLDIIFWIHCVTISEFHKWLWTINSYRRQH